MKINKKIIAKFIFSLSLFGGCVNILSADDSVLQNNLELLPQDAEFSNIKQKKFNTVSVKLFLCSGWDLNP